MSSETLPYDQAESRLQQVLAELHDELRKTGDTAYSRASHFARTGRFFCFCSPIAPLITWVLLFSSLPEAVRTSASAIVFVSIAAGSLTISCGVALLAYASKLQMQVDRVQSIKLKIRELHLIEALEGDHFVREGLLIAALVQMLRLEPEGHSLAQSVEDSIRDSASLRSVIADTVKSVSGRQ